MRTVHGLTSRTPDIHSLVSRLKVSASQSGKPIGQTMAATPDVGADNISPALVKAALQLQTRGYAIIESVISPEESERYIDRCWSWLESLGTGRPLVLTQ